MMFRTPAAALFCARVGQVDPVSNAFAPADTNVANAPEPMPDPVPPALPSLPVGARSIVHYRPRVDAEAVIAQLGHAAAIVSPSEGTAWHTALLGADAHQLEFILTAALMSWLADNDLLPGTWPGPTAG